MWTPLANSTCELGESPFWHPDEAALYWLDIPGRALLRTRGAIGADVQVERWPMPQEPGCMAPARSGGLVIALRDGIYRARQWGAELQRMVRAPHDPATLRFNDGKCDPLGRFWAGSLNEPKTARDATLYCLQRPAGAPPVLQPVLGEATTANGLAFTQHTLYWTDTPSHAIRAWEWESQTNTLGAARLLHQFADKAGCAAAGQPYGGRPDGATLDAQGRYWVAMYEGAQLLCLDAQGAVQQSLPLPAQCPTMPCLGGEDLRTLFVTTGRKGRPADELQRQSHAGKVFMARSEVQGVPVDFFDD
ncbi:SMP-30/gluconolactonase/LRE family protein [Xenophilus arseniciresistens]|uniref:SMP-30/gluconolactonase/LRE family protein n=1 Tax=Xenophilus arseniciresistens TaxID=1283306 RepID=A0AAE3T1Y0_9BURK|nr:SMP-30/gluconolactonase/LRE family protein [Xenophilus arseniciresistens]MDA7418446.1 SMP-30/gluconolactonase/LRE family protein [Xenophilus arseniciresistens]